MDRRSQINKYLAGELEVEEANKLLEWINSPEGQLFLAEEAEEIWNQGTHEKNDFGWDGEKLWQKIRHTQQLAMDPEPKNATGMRDVIPFWLKVASSFILFAFLSGVLFSIFHERTEDNLADKQQLILRYNPPGQKSKIQLSDGSIIFLNADSKVEFPSDFTTNRHVKLEGEAYFSVAKDSLHPFIVESRGIQTRVLGTTFNIAAFPEEDLVQVTLLSGRVTLEKIGSDEEVIVMSPGEEAVLSQVEEGHTLRQVKVGKRVSWTSGILEFEDAPFPRLVNILEKWYGVEIEVQGVLPEALSSGTFSRDESLENVLSVLSPSIGFNYTINNSQVIIHIE